MRIITILSFWLALWASMMAAPAMAAPKVVVSIKPVHGLATRIMQDVATPLLLIKGMSSPHVLTLKPSQMRALGAADLVIVVDRNLERKLVRSLAALKPVKLLVLAEIPGIKRLDPHGTGRIDPHLWLDPGNAKHIVSGIARALARIDPSNAAHYRANEIAALKELTMLDNALRKLLAPVQDKPFLSYHYAYRYFEAAYGLKAIGALTSTPEIPPGARTLKRVRKIIRHQKIKCVFAEPQFSSRLIDALIANTGAKKAIADPIGVKVKPGAGAYIEIMENIGRAFADCLAR